MYKVGFALPNRKDLGFPWPHGPQGAQGFLIECKIVTRNSYQAILFGTFRDRTEGNRLSFWDTHTNERMELDGQTSLMVEIFV